MPGALHGYAAHSDRVRETLDVQQGSLYPALHRLERKGLVAAEWKEAESGRMAKFYSLTGEGRKQLHEELDQWRRYAQAIGRVLEA